MTIVNSLWQVVLHSPTNIVDLASLGSWKYQLEIVYDLNVPQYYIRMMRDLELKYDISLTERETHILSIDPVYEYKSVVFAGDGIEFTSITWQVDQTAIFDASLWDAVAYHLPLTTWSTSLTISFTKSDIN